MAEWIQLPLPQTADTSAGLRQALARRRTLRAFSDAAISQAAASDLLWAGQGVTGREGGRAAPSAHALYPLHLFLCAGRVENLPPGVYDCDPEERRLRLLRDEDVRAALEGAALEDQPWIGQAAVVIVVAADMGKALAHFAAQPPHGERGARYVYFEAGAVSQNMQLLATELGLAAVPVMGFDDVATTRLLGLPSPWTPVLLFCLGRAQLM